jgi:hypothetical protein
MFELLCGTAADQAFVSGDQNSVDLLELRLEQSIKPIVEGGMVATATPAAVDEDAARVVREVPMAG